MQKPTLEMEDALPGTKPLALQGSHQKDYMNAERFVGYALPRGHAKLRVWLMFGGSSGIWVGVSCCDLTGNALYGEIAS